MNFEIQNPRTLRLFFADKNLFNTAKNLLESLGFPVIEFFDSPKTESTVLLDSFFLRSGLGEYFHQMNSELPLLCVIEEAETGNIPSLMTEPVDEFIILQNDWRSQPFPRNTEALNQSEYLRLLGRTNREFGKGLWTSLMQQWQEFSLQKTVKVCV